MDVLASASAELLALLGSGIVLSFLAWTADRIRREFHEFRREWEQTHRLARDNADVLADHGLIEEAETKHVREEERAASALVQALATGEIESDDLDLSSVDQ
ncbi:hypothetical protein [Halosegnis longus]|uniref:hypothetical protein n=1 Tax=Halosegnis longus TaxID=2216012 RepID=UPI00129D357C|nr:hypothetical protein [Halosegnis longus]